MITVGVCSPDIDVPGTDAADAALIHDGLLEMYAYRAPQGGALDLFGRRWPTIETLGKSAFASLLYERIQTDAVYVTVDKDVLKPSDAATNWDQGEIGLDYLKTLIGVVASGRRLNQPWASPSPGAKRLNEAVNIALLDCFERVVQ